MFRLGRADSNVKTMRILRQKVEYLPHTFPCVAGGMYQRKNQVYNGKFCNHVIIYSREAVFHYLKKCYLQYPTRFLNSLLKFLRPTLF